MRGFSTGLLLGLILGAVGFWYVQKKGRENPAAQQRYEQSAAQLRTNATAAARNMSDALRAELDTLGLRSEQINDELSRNGKIFRSKPPTLGDQLADAAADERAIAGIKTKFAADATLSGWSITVGCTQGHATLAGTVASPDDIGRAVALALDADGVHDVTSMLTLRPKPAISEPVGK